MTQELPGKRYAAVNAWPDPGTPGRWRYLPHEPAPQRGGNGRAMVTAIEAGDALILTLGTSLAVSDAEQAAAKALIAAETGVPTAEIDLRPADAGVSAAALVLTVEGETPVELATARPSPTAPYSAAFSAMLQGDRAKKTNAAMKTGKGRLSVRYDVELATTRAVTATLSGDPTGIDDIEAAIANGRLTLTMAADPGASDALRADARKRVGEQAAQLLDRLATPSDADCEFEDVTRSGRIATEVTRTETVRVPLQLQANVAEWLH